MTDTTVTAGRIRAATATIAAAWPDMVPTEPTARPAGTIGRSAERVDPVHAHVLDVRVETDALLVSWARVVLEERAVETSIAAGDVPALAALIREHATWLAGHEAGTDAADELEAAAKACHGVAYPHGVSDRRLVGLCPSCGTRLDAAPDATWLECPCGDATDVRHVREAGREVIRDRLCTALDAERIGLQLGVPVRRPTVRSWVARGQLLPVACTVADRANIYRWGDLERLVRDMATRTGRAHAS